MNKNVDTTDVTGQCFISYRRTRSEEITLLVKALRSYGIPVWQDIHNLEHLPTESELRNILTGSNISSAILYITPEVETSDIIRKVEAPIIFYRSTMDNGFFVFPIINQDLSYKDAGKICTDNLGLYHIPNWNMERLKTPINEQEAERLSKIVLSKRLIALDRYLEPEAALRVEISTRQPLSHKSGMALELDLTDRFEGRLALEGTWPEIIKNFSDIAEAIAQYCPERKVELSGFTALPAAFTLGCAFLSLRGVNLEWKQPGPDFAVDTENWSLSATKEDCGFIIEEIPDNTSAGDIAVLVSVTNDVTADFRRTVNSDNMILRAILSIRPKETQNSKLNKGTAADLTEKIIQGIRNSRETYKTNGSIHIFMSGPAGLAFLIGQRLNTFGKVQTYEYVAGNDPPYIPAALINPSSL